MTPLAFPAKPMIAPDAARDIATGARISAMYGRPIGPADVAQVMNAAKQKYVLAGAHAANGYTSSPRTTVDVDIIAAKPKQARDALAAAFPDLTVEEHPVVIRFKDGLHEAIDVIRPETSKVFKALLKLTRSVKIGGVDVTIPTAEGVLAAKFNAMVTPTRKLLDRQQDGLDFARVVEAVLSLGEPKLRELGELVYAGGGDEIMKLIADVRAGRPLTF